MSQTHDLRSVATEPKLVHPSVGSILARASGGAIFFALPLLLTMEMWWLGFYMDRFRLGVLMTLMIPLLILLSHTFRWTPVSTWGEAVRQGFIAYGVGLATSGVILLLLGIFRGGIGEGEFLGKIWVQAIPASIGAVLGANQFALEAPEDGEERRARAGYGTELFLIFTGALYLGISVAPTEEMIVIAFKMSYAHAAALGLVSLFVIHILVYTVDFRRKHIIPAGTPFWSYFLRFSVVAYAISLLVSAFVLWAYGRLDGTGIGPTMTTVMVLAFPAGLGASAARLIL